MKKTQRLTMVLTVVAMMMAAFAPAALGKPSYDNFDAKAGWSCGSAEGLVPNHCINAKGKTFNIKVFEPDPRGPQESASTDPKADSRPCPHDEGGGSDPTAGDGTWWDFLYGTGLGTLYVCHHSGQQQFLP